MTRDEHEPQEVIAARGVVEHRVEIDLLGADLDLRRAQFAAREVVITINAVMGGADIKVNPHTHVIMEGTGIMGGYSGPSGHTDAELDANSPVVRIRGFALMGGVNVSRRPVPGQSRQLRPR